MINKIVPHLKLVTIFILFYFLNATAETTWAPAIEGNKIILIRHSLAPGGGDPSGFKINDCKTQRNLSKEGIEQSKKIGKLFQKNQIKIDQVLSSQWCRCKDTAKYAFGKYEEFSALNSTFQKQFSGNETEQIRKIKKYINNWEENGKNLVFVTHYSIITKLTNAIPDSGEIIIINKKLQVLSNILTD